MYDNQPKYSTIIAKEVVNDILKVTLDITTTATKMDDRNASSKGDDTKFEKVPLEKDTKRVISEILTYLHIPNCGVGDQPSEGLREEMVQPPPKAVEKKSRVTDLIKNSPRIIKEYLKMDSLAKENQEKWEEEEEKCIQVIDLDIPGPEEDVEETVIFMPSEANMDVIDLTESVKGMQGDTDGNRQETVPEILTMECGGGGERSVIEDKEVSSQCSVTESESRMEKGWSWFCGIGRIFRRKQKHKQSDVCNAQNF